jgi:hypothetical protein
VVGLWDIKLCFSRFFKSGASWALVACLTITVRFTFDSGVSIVSSIWSSLCHMQVAFGITCHRPTMATTSPLGSSIPPHTAHAISVSLPTWVDVVGYEEGERRVIDAMKTGYPRFFIHLNIQKVCVLWQFF